uniref:hypothetical protein n=1 Tax=Providencia alcalifaciens TaxID=126385 RepID=UPI002B061692
MENFNQENHSLSFAVFFTALGLSLALLILNHDIKSQFFISISIVSIIATVLFIFSQYKFAFLKSYIAVIYLIISVISLWMLIGSSIDEQ